MNMDGAEILITGGAGFIGSNLAEKLLQKGAKITVVDAMIAPYGGNLNNLAAIKKAITFVRGDIREQKLMNKLVDGKDFVYHLAGQTGRTISMKKPKLDFAINCTGTLVLLNAIKKQKRKPKIIFSSSRGVIGKPVYLPVDEKHGTFPRDVYGAHKLLAEQYLSIYGREHGIVSSILRFNNVYGPKCQIKSNHYGTVNLFIASALQGKKVQIFGDGNQTRDYLYVGDAVNSLIKAAHKKADNQIFFVGTEKEHSLLEVAQLIRGKVNSLRYEIIPYPKSLAKIDFPRFVSSYKKINEVLGWKPLVTLQQGVHNTVLFYKNNMQDYI